MNKLNNLIKHGILFKEDILFFQSKKQSKLSSMWVESDDDDCMIIDPIPAPCHTAKKTNVSVLKANSTKVGFPV